MSVTTLSRRRFLKVFLTAAGGVVIGLRLPELAQGAPDRSRGGGDPGMLNAFVRIEPDDSVVIGVSQPEMGQGMYTTMPMLVAEELDADWSRVSVEQLPLMLRRDEDGNLAWALVPQGAGGSTSVVDLYRPLREFGAGARAQLLAAAADLWEVSSTELVTEPGVVLHPPSGRRARYGALAGRAAALPPVAETPRLKAPSEFRLIGHDVAPRRLDEIVTGRATYGIDVREPDMRHAVIARCPWFDGRLLGFDDAAALAVPGVEAVAEVPGPAQGDYYTTLAPGVAVIADSTWAALRGREALSVRWDRGPWTDENTPAFDAACRAALDAGPGQVVQDRGDFDAALAGAARTVTRRYRLPYVHHATLEPQNCYADVRKDRCVVRGPIQMPAAASRMAARLTGLDRLAIDVHMTRLGGGFGRRLTVDYVAEAVLVSRAAGVPVKVVWTREDDMAHDFLRPGGWHELTAGLDETGGVVAWRHRVASPSKYYRRPDEELWRSEIYEDDPPVGLVDNVRYEYYDMTSGAWRGSWRAPAHTANAFVVQSFLDELADEAGRDPLEYRLAWLGEPRTLPYANHGGPEWDPGRLAAVLKLAAEQAGWGRALPEGEGLGLACHFTFGGYAAWVAHVKVAPDGRLRVLKLTGAVDCGLAVNPNGVRAQMEGGACDALSTALGQEITIAGGRHRETNFDDYRMMRIVDAPPEIAVHIVQGADAPAGLGEPPVPPLAPAVANAVHAAVGKRIRSLPMGTRLDA
jgi:isoquinoline 1-oxidoreductase beta subunit